MRDPTRRFSDRVEDYVRSRPSYPPELIDVLTEVAGLEPQHRVVDVGSGTGKLSRLFLEYGNRVDGIEPNPEMRAAGEREFADFARFTSIDGRAEATGLPDAAADLVVAGQAFHWFDAVAARREFLRILRPDRPVVLVWNDRDEQASAFMQGYERLLREHGTDYRRVHHRRFGEAEIRDFFAAGSYVLRRLPYRQRFDREGLRSRLRSSSYVPAPGQRGHERLVAALDALFDAHQHGGEVDFPYVTRLYVGRPIERQGRRSQLST